MKNNKLIKKKEAAKSAGSKVADPQVTLKFSNEKGVEFSRELRKRVKYYFEERGISKYANANMIIKTVFMLSVFLVPYILMVSGLFTNVFLILTIWMVMGFGAAGIGLAVMHDANHKSYSSKKTLNGILGYLLNLIGGDASTWKIQHNIKHHGFTNIEGYDEDINAGPLLRFSPSDKLLKIHRYQHIYAWFLYCLMTLQWVTVKDFKQLYHYRKEGFIPGSTFNFTVKIAIVALSKILYYVYILIVPIILLPLPVGVVIIFFLIMHFITGFTLTIIFQTAHVMPSSQYPVPDEKNTISENWLEHQMSTTTNYSPRSKIFSWLIGGLNYQVEHHLFPNICHVHYPKLSAIVNATAQSFKIRYNVQPNFLTALISHARMLKQLGTT
jgi:linoleoyl-CoA desaturase